MSDRDIVGTFSNEPSISGQFEPDIIIKGSMEARFPANVYVISPIQLDRTGGNYTFSLDLNELIESLPPGGVTSVFGRTGDVTAQSGDYTFAQISSTPTTLSGYGILDAQPLDADLTAISGLVTATYGRSLLTLANATALAAEVDSFFLTPTEGNAAYQPLDSDLTAIAALTTTAYGRSLLTLANATALAAEVDSFFLTPAEGNAAYQPLDSDLTAIAALTTVTFGRALLTETSATTLKTTLSLQNLDNTSDANKPVSTAQQTALNLKANIASPTFTGTPAAPTAAPGANTTQLATTAFVEAARVILAAATALKANIASPTFTGTPAAPTAAVDTNTTQLATTAMVLAQAASATPLVDATPAVVGTSTRFARGDHVHPTDTSRAPLASPTFTGTPAAPTAALDTNTTQLATTAFVQTARSLTPGFVSIKVQNNATDANNDIDFLAGRARDSTDVDNIVLASTLVKRLDAAWTVGTNQGGLDTGSKANNTFYYLWAIKRPDTGVVDALFSTSATAPTMPASYTLKQRVGAVRTDGSGNLRAFFQHANQLDYFQYVAPIADVADTSLASASRDAFALTVPPGSVAKFRAVARDPTTSYSAIAVVLTTASENDSGADLASSGNASLGGQFATYYGAGAFSGEFEVLADGSSQIYARAGGGTDTAIYIRTKGFVLQRGIF